MIRCFDGFSSGTGSPIHWTTDNQKVAGKKETKLLLSISMVKRYCESHRLQQLDSFLSFA